MQTENEKLKNRIAEQDKRLLELENKAEILRAMISVLANQKPVL